MIIVSDANLWRDLDSYINATTMYGMAEIKKDRPIIAEIPPDVLGAVDNAYFRYVSDVGNTGPEEASVR
ncbi:MAG: hypothetical protein F6K18_12470 [Okeania sp. SIO2C2]|uniref:hypothetical protein n=1 Tax=Okeania sp. SIO2C2 TaxID=2607787 RepID=UPI0013B7B1AC|nr:hypothetical protein [Okeania sp. SIO2C2]NEP87566.1 hypothetical protein [Okeania sp. SIO2C2]